MRYEKRSLLCLTFLYVLQTEEGGRSGPVVEAGNGNYVAVLGPAKKKLTWSDMSLLVISTKSIELVFCFSVLPQIYFLSFDLELAA